MPDATCVISMGVHLADGCLRYLGRIYRARKVDIAYLFYGYGLVNLQLGHIADQRGEIA